MSYAVLYATFAKQEAERVKREMHKNELVPALLRQFKVGPQQERHSGWTRMDKCRKALEALDRQGWNRSFHQKQFHDQFMRACTRVFWKTEASGQFARDHKTILELNGWESLPQELLISTPRRFGKTISVSMFAAAMIFSTPSVEISIYSTCLRISHKLLRNIGKFLNLIFTELNIPYFPVVSANMEELRLRGPEGAQDLRVVNSYPSKVTFPFLLNAFC